MRRAVVVDGVRTPFFKAFGPLRQLDTIALGVATVRTLVERLQLDPREVTSLIWGAVVIPPATPNVGREIGLDAGLPPSVEAMTVSRACASGLSAITTAVCSIERGEADICIAGGSDSTSNAAVTLAPEFMQKLGPTLMSGRSGPLDYVKAFGGLNLPRDLLPQAPRVAERSTGETMGQAAERMAERNEISRLAQDEFAVRSHQRAANAVRSGRFSREICRVTRPDGEALGADGLIRADTSVEKLARLKPAFKTDGTLTAGNSTALTDGAAAVVLMSEEKARALGYQPLAALRSWAYVGVDPADQLLIGPALAMPQALDRANLELSDVSFIDLHEAFAAQCLSVIKAMKSDAFAQQRLGRERAVGLLDDARLNVHGGSLAIGHPFAATGARMVTTMANELAMSGERYALLGICAAGGLGAAAVLERVE